VGSWLVLHQPLTDRGQPVSEDKKQEGQSDVEKVEHVDTSIPREFPTIGVYRLGYQAGDKKRGENVKKASRSGTRRPWSRESADPATWARAEIADPSQ
jgi:hypothetical protein